MPDPSPVPASPDLRDLIYLDFERVRTLVAGLGIESRLQGPDRGGRYAFAPATAAAGASEPHSLQSAVFAELEAALLSQEKLLDITPTFDFASLWKPDKFRDGQLIRVMGMVRVLDYPWLASVMETMPRMLKVTHRAELSALKQEAEAHQITQAEVEQKAKEQQSQLKDLETWRIDELTEVVRKLFGQTVRVKVLPYGSKGGEMLVGSCVPGHFVEPPALLSQNYGTDINAAWSLLGIVNVTPPAPAPPLPTGNAVEDMFERLALAVNRIHRVASPPDFPAVAVTPIALYRTLSRRQ